MIPVLARYLVRTVHWYAVPMGLVAGLAFVFGARIVSGRWMTASLLFALTAMAAGVGFALDDPAGDTLAGVPVPLWLRASRAALVAAGVAVVSWALLLLVVSRAVPVRDLTVMAGAVWTVALAIAATARRRLGPVAGGLVAAPTVTVLSLASTMVPDPWALSPGHAGMVWRWSVIAGVAVVLYAWAVRDPAWGRT